MKSIRVALLTLALCSAGAQAEEPAPTLQASLTADGMSQLGEGLRGRRAGGDEAYVAYTPAGQQALLQRLLERRAAAAAFEQTGRTTPNALDRLIAQLSQTAQSLDGRDDSYGDCSGRLVSGPFRVQAAAVGGTSASAHVDNTSNPTIDTINTAYAFATDPSGDGPENQSTAHGNTTAHASSSVPKPGTACRNQTAESYASATITCPGASSPAITAIAISQVDPNLPCPR